MDRSRRLAPASLLLILGVFFVVSLLGGVAGAEKPIRITSPSGSEVVLNDGFFPKALPRQARVPVAFSFAIKVRSSADDTFPPALRRLTIGLDRDVSVVLRGLPACRLRSVRRETVVEVEKACEDAIVGSGMAEFSIRSTAAAHPTIGSRFLLVNGGERPKSALLYAIDDADVGTPGIVVMPIWLKRDLGGALRTRMTVWVPEIAGGAGSLGQLTLALGGALPGVVTARCSDGVLVIQVEATLGDRTSTRTKLRRACQSHAVR